MNTKQKQLLTKLNNDNAQLASAHKDWIAYSKGRIIIGALAVGALLAMYFFG